MLHAALTISPSAATAGPNIPLAWLPHPALSHIYWIKPSPSLSIASHPRASGTPTSSYQPDAGLLHRRRPSGLLIYAAGEDEPAEYRINHAGKAIEVVALDLSGTPENTLGEVDRLAERVRVHAYGPSLRATA